MVYEKIGWKNGQAPFVNAGNLNHMDQGIKDNSLLSLANADKLKFVNSILIVDNWTMSSDFSNYSYHYDVIDPKFDASAQTIDVFYDDTTEAKALVIEEASIRANGVHDSTSSRIRIYSENNPSADISVRFEVRK